MTKLKTEQTLAVIKKKCEQFTHGAWKIELVVYDGEIVGYNELDKFKEKFRVQHLKKILDKKDLIV